MTKIILIFLMALFAHNAIAENRDSLKYISDCKYAMQQDVKTFTVGGVSFKMIRVPEGSFKMGATEEQGINEYMTEPVNDVHDVTLSSYYIGETEVTQGLWKAVMGDNPSRVQNGDDYPVDRVSWFDCREFVRKLSEKTGCNFRLPTEAEWEFAARGGCQGETKFAGSDYYKEVAWYQENLHGTTHQVATKKPNKLGIYDMNGNVAEWCADWFGDYPQTSVINPTGASTGKYRVYRGGSGYDVGSVLQCVACRWRTSPSSSDYRIGLRVVLIP